MSDFTGAFVGRHYDIQVLSGGRFDLLDPRPEDVNLTDIAHALAQLCRFTGHCRPFYSVGQHCLMVSRLVPPELALQGLLHDAAEAYVGDVSRPLKNVLDEVAPGVLKEIETRVEQAIFTRFDVAWPMDPAVKLADNVALATEKRDVMRGGTEPWHNMPDPLPDPIVALSPVQVIHDYAMRFIELGGEL